ELFLALGDNTSQSFDSRSYGPVPNKNIIGKVLGIK
ncbi:MAG: S26 family signal peptidase, partial [Treponema sp.]|nr:S26 family signal peptidase [Treponema sp.]